MLSVGEAHTMRAFFFNANGAAVDPATIVLTITEPDGSTITKNKADLAVDGVGRFHYTEALTLAGVRSWEFVPSLEATEGIQGGRVLVGTDLAGPCQPWLDPEEVFALSPASAIPEAERDYLLASEMAAAASRTLFVLSERRYPGICRDVVRPCRRCSAWSTPGWWSWDSAWGTCGCGASSPAKCGCGSLSEILLGNFPVVGIEEVRVDGVVIASSGYRVDNMRLLVRDEDESWPSCQNLWGDPATDDDTFEVTYFYGRPVPADGKLAAERLAGDLYAGASGLECKLPANVQSIIRQGVEISFGDPNTMLAEEALTSLREVDLFLTAERYNAAHRTAITVSPDTMPAVRRTG